MCNILLLFKGGRNGVGQKKMALVRKKWCWSEKNHSMGVRLRANIFTKTNVTQKM
jgi:hypothetical protein